MRLTVKNRILLYLLEHSANADAAEVSPALIRESIARASRINTRHLAQYVRPLSREGLVRERLAHVEGIRHRRKVYALTPAGELGARQLRQVLETQTVRVTDGSGVRETTVSRVLATTRHMVPASSILIQAGEEGIVNLEHLRRGAPAPFVEILPDAPSVEGFVGRREELRVLTTDTGHQQIFVIQGIAGIGKSSLAAKACELERGKRNLFWHKVRPWDTHQTLFAALAEFFKVLDRPGLRAILERGETNRAPEILREDLRGIRALLVFDDVHQASREALSFFTLCKDAVAKVPDARMFVLTRHGLSFYDARDTVLRRQVREIDLQGLRDEAVGELFSAQRASRELLASSRQLHGHPLFCRLLLSSGLQGLPSRFPRDARRFIEEQVYAGLAREEAAAMKAASLFQVPVPRSAILSVSETTAEAFHSLVGRFLIRPVGQEAFELHETVRDYFLQVLSSKERRDLIPLVVEQLKRLASAARVDADFGACIGYLSNALRLVDSPKEAGVLREALGDANGSLGDLGAALVSYKLSGKTARDPETRLRLRRKSAEALSRHGEFRAAWAEAEAAILTIGGLRTVERGWLQLVRCRTAVEREEPELLETAEASGRDALTVFAEFGEVQGQAQAFLELGKIDLLRAPQEVAESASMKSALDLGTSLADWRFVAKVHLAMADIAYTKFANPTLALARLAAIEAIPGSLDDPMFASRFFWERGEVKYALLDDRTGAMEDLRESLRLARLTRDLTSIGHARLGFGVIHFISARYENALIELEEAATLFRAQELSPLEFVALWMIAECYLYSGDFVGFRRTLKSLDRVDLSAKVPATPLELGPLATAPIVAGYHGLDHLLRGDSRKSREAFREAIRSAEGREGLITRRADFTLPWVLCCAGNGFRAMGSEHEGDQYFSRGLELLRVRHLDAARALESSDETKRLVVRLRSEWRKSARKSGADRRTGHLRKTRPGPPRSAAN